MKNNRNQTQAERILAYIREQGSITSLEAADRLRITSLTQRISELRQRGYPIHHRVETSRHIDGKPVKYNRYYLVEAAEPADGESWTICPEFPEG